MKSSCHTNKNFKTNSTKKLQKDMKHLFVVHSGITCIVAKQFIKESNISFDDCLFITRRNIKLPESIINHTKNIINYPQDILKKGDNRIFVNNNPISGLKNIKLLEDKINLFFCGHRFSLYLPNTASCDLMSVLVTMKTCSEYYLFEEGLGQYIKRENLKTKRIMGMNPFFFKILRFLFPRFYKLRDEHYSISSHKYVGHIAISEDAFPEYQGKKILINCPFDKISIKFKADVILSIDAGILHYIDYKNTKILYNKLAKIFNEKGYKKIAYKFHPDYYENMNVLNKYRILLKDAFGQNIEEIEPNIFLENYIITCNADFYSDRSSVGFYVSKYGIKNYSYYNLIKGISMDYDELQKPGMELFKKCSIMLENTSNHKNNMHEYCDN